MTMPASILCSILVVVFIHFLVKIISRPTNRKQQYVLYLYRGTVRHEFSIAVPEGVIRNICYNLDTTFNKHEIVFITKYVNEACALLTSLALITENRLLLSKVIEINQDVLTFIIKRVDHV